MTQRPLTYKDAGVDIAAVTSALETVGHMAASTHTEKVLTGLGSFGALFDARFEGIKEPVLVSSTDGVGTKVLLAQRLGRFDTLGADLVNHCINDILVMGAEPLFFLDYVAGEHFREGMLEAIVSGFARSCKEQGVALIGGETAEMPGVYPPGHFDLAGFIVGVAEKGQLLTGDRIAEGDVLVALRSSGLHTNGYSLAQKILLEGDGAEENLLPDTDVSVGEALIREHRCYLKPLRALLREEGFHGMVHVTGGGFTDNIPRVLPENLGAVIDRDAWVPDPVFCEIARRGPVERDEMDRTFNMGLGMLLIIGEDAVKDVTQHLREEGEEPLVVGKVEAGDGQVRYVGDASL
ncbi:MAG: phosphoribosylformylglycinamidine cyclo-ligase [Planctomycetota bacterium]|nr:phosphoribosylformylglycinamidine cyclo-ligase [Planctomycetota bacterium]